MVTGVVDEVWWLLVLLMKFEYRWLLVLLMKFE